jgi:GT2 family glycosyltransferase/glycosyltransferase involved in cell wall biosynthesis
VNQPGNAKQWHINGPALELNKVLGLHPDPTLLLERLESAADVTVVIPVYNGGPAVARCLASVRANTRHAAILVIDDASSDPQVVSTLDSYARSGDIKLVRHPENMGYTRTVNEALELAGSNDVVLLNSDTQVGPLWLNRMRWVAYSEYEVATVTAVSDNAGAMSVPLPGKDNAWPSHLTWDEIARGVMQAAPGWKSIVPTGHGFCMYIRRYAIDKVGGFDEEAFPMGYGEENDFCQRAIAAGLSNLLAPHVIVHHDRSQSFGEERKKPLVEAGMRVVNDRYKGYGAAVSRWMNADTTKRQLSSLASTQAVLAHCHRVLPRRLYVIHRSIGGTIETNKDLLGALSDEQDAYIFDSTGDGEVGLHIWRGGKSQLLKTWKLSKRFAERDTWRSDYAEILVSILVGLAIELVHVRHLFQHPLLTAPRVFELLGIPAVLSTHDFYYLSPSITLLDSRANIKPGIPIPGLSGHLTAHQRNDASTPMTAEWLEEWQRRTRVVLQSFDALVATTKSAAAIYEQSMPDIRKLNIIEHGRDLGPRWDALDRSQRKAGPLRVAVAANWDPPKGIRYIQAVLDALGSRVEFHVLGRNSELIGGESISHGEYTRDSLRDVLEAIDPDIMGIFSVWPETYSHTLTEAWAFGVPVVSTDIGAVAERIRTHGGGWLVPVEDPLYAAELLGRLSQKRDEVDSMRGAVPRNSIRGTMTMSRDYLALYENIITPKIHLPRVGYVIREQRPASSHIRVLRRTSHPQVQNLMRTRQISAGDYATRADGSHLDTLVVQRDAVPPQHVDSLLKRQLSSGTRLILELDDDLLSARAVQALEADPYYEAERLQGIRRIARAADAIIVSTPALQKVALSFNRNVEVVPNDLDERLWRSKPYVEEPPSDDSIRILYMGTRTHRDDFEILVPVMDEVQTRLGRSVVLETIGIADGLPMRSWLRPIALPSRMSSYPMFVTWLRSMASRWELAVAPLADKAVNETKSDLKLLEYAVLGLPVIASDIGPYRSVHSSLAKVVKNTQEAWVEAIVLAATSPMDSDWRDPAARSHVVEQRMLGGASLSRWSGIVLGDRS